MPISRAITSWRQEPSNASIGSDMARIDRGKVSTPLERSVGRRNLGRIVTLLLLCNDMGSDASNRGFH